MTKVQSSADRPTVILRPQPQSIDRIFTHEALSRLNAEFTVINLQDDPSDGALDAALPDAFAIIGQPDLPRERLNRAPSLAAILNVEGNFFSNVDYEACFERGIHVLGCGPAYAQPVAELSLGLALDLARSITRADRDFRAGTEKYIFHGTQDVVLMRRASIGLIGYGNLGRAIHSLLRIFEPTVRIHDPWLPDSVIREVGGIPASLDETLSQSDFVFVLTTVTDANQHLIGGRELDLLPNPGRLIITSRAAVVDYEALFERVRAGRLTAAIDVWPEEPVPADYPARAIEGLVLSAHRAGAVYSAMREVGNMVVDDLCQVKAALPPVRMQVAARQLVSRYRNKPID